ncbi:MAG: ferritin-like domain-containing protein [Candidatus Brocadiia bacterium]
MDKKQILKAAIKKEVEAHDLYADMAERTDNPGARSLLEDLAEEEDGHRQLLEGLSAEEIDKFTPPEKRDLKLTEHLKSKPLKENSSLQDVLVHAMEREKRAREFYETMAQSTDGKTWSTLFGKLAKMENTHKARLEEFYEEVFLQEM